MMGSIPKVVEPLRAEPSSNAGQSASADEELKAWDFVRMGLLCTLVVVALLVMAGLVMASQGDYNAEFIPRALRLAVGFSIVIWGGIGLVAIPTLVVQRMERIWAHRRSKRRAGSPGLWDDWIDGPGSR
jgi:cytochrome c biogenesis protein CcdA